MRERGVQSRRARESGPNLLGSPGGGGPGIWPAVAIIAVIIATAGWTTVGVLVLNKPAATASAPAASDDVIDEGSLPPDEPLPESHLFPDLEALLPTEVDATKLNVQSMTGTDWIPDDGWGTGMTTFLTSVGKTPADLQLAQAEDPDQGLDLDFIVVFRLAGVAPETLQDQIINGWRTDFPELTTTTATIAGKAITKGSFGEDAVGSIWYLHDGVIYDIESSDETLATTILAALPPATTPPAGSPAASGAASASPAP